MATGRNYKRAKPSLEDRFEFVGDAVAPGDREALRSAMFDVEDRLSGVERCLKLWRKTGTAVDEDLRQLWLHEMRQVQRVMSYAGARDVIVDVLEFVEDDEDFGVVLERVGQPLSEKRKRVSRQHWLRNLNAPRSRVLFWRNIARLVIALGIVHKQSLVHGRISADVVMTEGTDDSDFQLGGFEWSLWLSSDLAEKSQAKLGPAAAVKRAESYSFADDWRAFGLMIADCLETIVQKTGEIYPKAGSLIVLDVPERALLRRLVTPARMDHLDADSIARSIHDLIASVSRASSVRAGTFIVIGGTAHRDSLEAMLAQAHRRMIIHSTFLDAKRFQLLADPIRAACVRGVQFDLLWGAEKDDETEKRNSTAASDIAKLVREDPAMKGRFRVRMKSTGSHAKVILYDTAEDGWIAAVGSCNWLSSPFQSVELSVVLRDQRVVADLAFSIQRLVGRRGLADDMATEMAVTTRDLRRHPSSQGPAKVSIVIGETHDRLIRTASGAAHRFLVGSHRLGSTARPGAIMQGEAAAGRKGVKAIVLYTQPSGPLKNRHTRALEEEADGNGLILRRTRKPPLHGKFAAWDNNDIVITSLNWASAATDPDFPWGDIGVHINAPGIANELVARLGAILPELRELESPENVA